MMAILAIFSGVFEAVRTQLSNDFLDAIKRSRTFTSIAAIKSFRKCGPTASKTALKIGNFHFSPKMKFLDFSNFWQRNILQVKVGKIDLLFAYKEVSQ